MKNKTEMQILRSTMFDEITRLKRGTSDKETAMAVCKLGNVVVQSYNTELKAIDAMIRVQEAGAKVPDISIFSTTEMQIDEK